MKHQTITSLTLSLLLLFAGGVWAESLLNLEDLTETEYISIHNETYWFIEEERTLEGSYIGSVRSNLIWADRMSVFVDQANCGLNR